MDIFERISYIIKNEDVTIAEFSRKIGIGDQTVRSMLEKRTSFPSFKVIHGICNTYENYSARWLITGKGDIIENSYDRYNNECNVSEGQSEYVRNVIHYKLNKNSVDELIKTNLTLAKCIKDQIKQLNEIKDILDNRTK